MKLSKGTIVSFKKKLYLIEEVCCFSNLQNHTISNSNILPSKTESTKDSDYFLLKKLSKRKQNDFWVVDALQNVTPLTKKEFEKASILYQDLTKNASWVKASYERTQLIAIRIFISLKHPQFQEEENMLIPELLSQFVMNHNISQDPLTMHAILEFFKENNHLWDIVSYNEEDAIYNKNVKWDFCVSFHNVGLSTKNDELLFLKSYLIRTF